MSALGIGKASDTGLTVKADEFNACLREMRMALRGSNSYRAIVDHEAGRVIEKAAQLTGSADREKIRVSVKNKSTFKINGKTYNLRNWRTGQVWRVPPGAWSEIQRIKAGILRRKLAAVGITKRSWLDLGLKFGQPIKVPAFVSRASVPPATPTGGNTLAAREGTEDKYGIRLTNQHPLLDVPATQGVRAFYSALAGRIGFFNQNMKRGVFDKLATVVKKYPGMKWEG